MAAIPPVDSPTIHQQREQQFIEHVEQLLRDHRLLLPTQRGRRAPASLRVDVAPGDRGMDLKRTMMELGRPDRQLEATMPTGRSLAMAVARQRFWLFHKTIARMHVAVAPPWRDLVSGRPTTPMSAGDVAKTIGQVPPPLGDVPLTVVIMSSSGFTADARKMAEHAANRYVILVEAMPTGEWVVHTPAELADIAELFDLEASAAKRRRVRDAIEAHRVELLSGSLAADKIAAATHLPLQLVEAEIKLYAGENTGLAARKLEGKLVLFRQGDTAPAVTGADMPFIERVKALFARKGEVEKKIAFLSERRAALDQQRDASYTDMSALEKREGDLRTEFKQAGGELSKRRITGQLLQLRKDIERRQQLLSMLNQQINIVNTHLHNLNLQQQGHAAKLPDSEELAADAAKAEDVLAELQASSEAAESSSAVTAGGLSTEEQALYEELTQEAAKESAAAKGEPAGTVAAEVAPSPAVAQPQPAVPQRNRSQPEAG